MDSVSYTLSDARRLNLFGEIDLGTYAHVSNALKYMQLKDSKKPIDLYLNTRGGDVINGLAIYDFIVEMNKTTPIDITVNGACMSMGTIILQAGRKRRAYKNSEFLLHEVQYGVSRCAFE